MTIRIWEKPKSQSTTVDFKAPSTRRQYGATGDTDKTAILMALASVMPAADTTIDISTGSVVTVFANKIDCEEIGGGGGIWDITVYYESTTQTIDVAFNFGVQSTKVFQSLQDIRSYNCLSPSSSGTNTLANAALDAAAAALTAVDAIDISAAFTAAAAAVTAANVSGVDATVKTKTLLAATKTSATTTDATTVAGLVTEVASNTDATAQDAYAGDGTQAEADAALASTNSAAATAAAAQSNADATAAAAAASDATAAIPMVDPGGVSAAAAAAAVAAANAAIALDTITGDAATAGAAASAAATAAATATTGDTAIGANGVPNFHKLIGVNGGEVEGVEIEVGKVEIAVTKKWSSAALAASYLKLLADYTDRSCVNDASFTITWLGQSLIFSSETLRFRCAPVKSDSGGQLEIVYNFAYQRDITRADNLTVGNSAPITKKGWHGYWIYSRPGTSANHPVMVPNYVIIYRVYPLKDFGALNL